MYSGRRGSTKQGYIQYFRIDRFDWKHLEIDLRTIPELKPARYLREILYRGAGHDYLAEITGISLMGSE